MLINLRPYQYDGAQFIVDNPRCGLFFDCGLGKTLTVLAAMSHVREEMLPALVVAPKRVAKHVWPAETETWTPHLDCKVIHGKTRLQQLFGDPADITATNPESLDAVIEFVNCLGTVPWKSVIVDESTYYKNWESNRWARLAALTQLVPRTVLMTGTPIAGRGHVDLWAQFALLHEANPLGPWDWFCDQFFSFDMYERARLRVGAGDVIDQMIAPLVLRRGVEELGDQMPSLVEIDSYVDMTPGARRLYNELDLQENSYSPMRTLASGFRYDRHWSGEVNPEWVHSQKLDALAEIRQSTLGEPLLVLTNFIAEADMLAAKFGAKIIDGRTASAYASQLIEAWNAKQVPMLVLHPRAAGHGLNLQRGGNRCVWFSLPDSGESYQQATARIYRGGQRAKTVFCHRIIARGTIDEAIAGLLKRKILNEQNLLAAIS